MKIYIFFLLSFLLLPCFSLSFDEMLNKLKDFAKNNDKLKETEEKIKLAISQEILKQALKHSLNAKEDRIEGNLDKISGFFFDLTKNSNMTLEKVKNIVKTSLPKEYDLNILSEKDLINKLFQNENDLSVFLNNIITSFSSKNGMIHVDIYHNLMDKLNNYYRSVNATLPYNKDAPLDFKDGPRKDNQNFNFSRYLDYALKYNTSFANFSHFLDEYSTFKEANKLLNPETEENKIIKDLSSIIHSMMKNEEEEKKIVAKVDGKEGHPLLITLIIIFISVLVVGVAVLGRRWYKRRKLGIYNKMEGNPLSLSVEA